MDNPQDHHNYLSDKILQTAGQKAISVGNIGRTITDELSSRTSDEWFIAELSSFQLATIACLHPKNSRIFEYHPRPS